MNSGYLVLRLWSLVKELASWRLVLSAVLLVACAALVLAPWTIRNYRLYGGFIPSDTTGAVNLLDNNAPTGYPSFRAIRASSDNPVERQRFATRQAWVFIGADPLRFARKVAYASWLAWSPETFRRTLNFWVALLERTRPAVLLAQLTVLYWPAIALAMLGLLFTPRDAAGARGYRAVMLVTVAYYTLTIGVATVAALLARVYFDSTRGLVTLAVRDNELRVEYLGGSVRQAMAINFAIAAFLGGLGGALVVMSLGHIEPQFSFWTTSGEFVFVSILAGWQSVAAVFVASTVLEVVRSFSSSYFPNTWQLALGVFLLLVIRFLPRGIGSLWTKKGSR